MKKAPGVNRGLGFGFAEMCVQEGTRGRTKIIAFLNSVDL
jgi:hypothetical protein